MSGNTRWGNGGRANKSAGDDRGNDPKPTDWGCLAAFVMGLGMICATVAWVAWLAWG